MTTHRLLASKEPSLVEHQQRFEPMPEPAGQTLITWLDDSGLTGRGGGGFPTGRKIASLTGRKPVVIGNGAEGEPLSAKDATLLARAPHLVLDGLSIVAAAGRVRLGLRLRAERSHSGPAYRPQRAGGGKPRSHANQPCRSARYLCRGRGVGGHKAD